MQNKLKDERRSQNGLPDVSGQMRLREEAPSAALKLIKTLSEKIDGVKGKINEANASMKSLTDSSRAALRSTGSFAQFSSK